MVLAALGIMAARGIALDNTPNAEPRRRRARPHSTAPSRRSRRHAISFDAFLRHHGLDWAEYIRATKAKQRTLVAAFALELVRPTVEPSAQPVAVNTMRAYVSKVNTRMKEAGKDPPADTNTNPLWKRIVSSAIANECCRVVVLLEEAVLISIHG